MNLNPSTRYHWLAAIVIGSLWNISAPTSGWSLDVTKPVPAERRETISLADAAVRALQSNLDISISRQTKDSYA